ncbi:MAG TPA: hypothetical protein VL093_12785 [Flavipsychrobacter sp.]|jgi:hypothetical protein|nr:hypothetical protein [Flavipsychrobacter sp.]
MAEEHKSWKLNLRYGKIKTPFTHYTLLAAGVVHDLEEGFECRPGKAFMGMKVWANTKEEAFDMIRAIGECIGFEVTGKIELYATDPIEPPDEKPHGYDINFSPYDE